ncbi:MAG: hypothetical protein QM610_12215 [Chitinophagaceae bacterium]
MKIRILLLSLHLLATGLYGTQAQVPQKISYQATVRNSTGNLVASATVGVKLSILQGSTSGTAVYVETQTPTTSTSGIFSLLIGNGTIVSGTMAAIDWSTGTYYLKSEIDPNGSDSYTVTATSQLLSVPYVLYAATADSAFSSISADSIADSKTTKINLTQSDYAAMSGTANYGLQMQNLTLSTAYAAGDYVKPDSVIGPVSSNKSESYPLLDAPLTYKTYETNLWRITGEYKWTGTETSITNPTVMLFKITSRASSAIVFAQAIAVPPGLSNGTVVPFSVFFPTVADATSAAKGYDIIVTGDIGTGGRISSLAKYKLTSISRTNF